MMAGNGVDGDGKGGAASVQAVLVCPSGRRRSVAWSSDRDGNWEVYVANTDGTGLVNVSSHEESDFHPSLQGN